MPSQTKSKIYFFLQTKLHLRERTRLKHFLADLFRKEKTPLASLSYIFCTDEQLLDINRQYLKHDYYTDIISFGLSAKGQPVEGEIYISVDRVRENARSLNEPLNQELHRVIFHGALHLCGFRDKTKKEIEAMREAEAYYLKRYFKSPKGSPR